MFAADFGVGQVLWSMLWFFLFFMWIWLVITVFADIMRSHDLGGWAKALWSIFIIFLPYLGVFVYLIVRGGGMTDRDIRQAERDEARVRSYIRDAAGSEQSPAEQLATLSDLHERGKLSEDEYARLKAKVLA
ncbi:MAG: SHOCT domain-containing protein [Desertimonas sp.]